MSTSKQDHLSHFLATFNATDLGEGDTIAGANLLAAMAVTLSNLARPGSGILTPEGRLMPMGCNLLASGSLVTDVVLSEVVTPVGCSQANLLRQLSRLLENDKEEEDRALPRRWTLSKGPGASPGENALFSLMTGDPDLPPLMGSYEDEWAEVLSAPPGERLDDLVRRPRSFIVAATPGHLEKQLPDAHLGVAMVATGLKHAADATRFGDLCSALMDGLIPGGPSGEMVRGRLLVTDPCEVLQQVVTTPGDKAGWLARLVWLIEGGAGPEAPPSPKGEDGIVKLPDLTTRFERAVRLILANRLNSHEPRPVIDRYDFVGMQTRWMRFLVTMEENLPHIRATARSLLASLVFGVNRLLAAAKTPKGFKCQIEGAEAFARFLVRRMANARTAMIWSVEDAQRRAIKFDMLRKLADGPLTVTELRRRFHRLPAGLCRELLHDLAAEDWVKPHTDRWGLPRDPSEFPRLCLEV